MTNRLLLNMAKKWRPELRKMSGLELISALIDLLSLLYWMPIAVVGLIWLTQATALQVIRESWPILLLASIIGWIFRQLEFSLRLEVRPGIFALAGGSFEMLVFWSLALLLGPTALWSAVLMALLNLIWHIRTGRYSRWYRWRKFTADLAVTGTAGLTALWVHRLQGGPLLASVGFSAAQDSLTSMLVATFVWFLLSRLLELPLLMYVSRSPEIVGSNSLTDQSTMIRFLLIGSSISGIADLFAILAALIYAEQNIPAYLFFLSGALLAALLANRSSAMTTRSEQRSRELQLLERMSRSLLAAQELRPALPNILGEYVAALFPQSRIEIRLFPDEILFRQTQERFRFSQSIWQRLLDKSEATLLLPAELPQDHASTSQWAGIAVPIRRGQLDAPEGAVCLASPLELRQIEAYRPTLDTIADQISSAIQRIELQEQALEEQAESYQKEVYAQAYQAEVFAQALALEKMTKELVVAGRIQSSFLPEELPEIPGWQVSVALEPAREASGDFYDFIYLPNGRIGFVIADVAEKGMGAALYMALSRTLIRTFALEYDTAPEKALQAANKRILADTSSDLFVTVFYAILDTDTGEMTYCNAGHNPPFLLQAQNGNVPLPLIRTALPLGILEDAEWGGSRVQLLPGDILAMYTDGVTEAQDENESFFGEEKLRHILSANIDRSADVIEDKIITAIYDFAGDAPQFDDIALMVLIRER